MEAHALDASDVRMGGSKQTAHPARGPGSHGPSLWGHACVHVLSQTAAHLPPGHRVSQR